MAGRLTWYADELRARLREAQRRAIDDVMAESVPLAASGFPAGSSGSIGASVKVQEPAKVDRDGATGVWGSKSSLAWIYEVGSFKRPAGWTIKPKKGKRALDIDGTYRSRAKHVAISARAPLRRTADLTYRTLAARVRQHFLGGR